MPRERNSGPGARPVAGGVEEDLVAAAAPRGAGEHADDGVEELGDEELEELLAGAALVDARLALEDDLELLLEFAVM